MPDPSESSPPPQAPSSLSGAEVTKVASLARLSLTDAQVELFASQLTAILGHAQDLDRLDLTGVAPMSHPLPIQNVMAADEPGPTLDRGEVLASAPSAEDHQFRVSKMMGGVDG